MAEKYCPSNGSEGCAFWDAFCDRCKKDAKYRETQDGQDGCKILAATMLYNKDDPRYPTEWIYDENGEPVCTAFEQEKQDG